MPLGYVFGLHLNFDPLVKPDDIENDAVASGDYEKLPAFRKYARLWLRQDYVEAVKKSRNKQTSGDEESLQASIASAYEEVAKRDDVEMLDYINEDFRLPKDGMQVHGEYTIYGHFFFLEKLLGDTGKIRFFSRPRLGL